MVRDNGRPLHFDLRLISIQIYSRFAWTSQLVDARRDTRRLAQRSDECQSRGGCQIPARYFRRSIQHIGVERRSSQIRSISFQVSIASN